MNGNAESAADTPVIDTRGLRCPWPVLRAARAMRQTRSFVLIADDPKAETELAGLAAAHGWTAATRQAGSITETRLEGPLAPARD